MLDHDAARLLFGGYLLGGLEDADRDALDAHLATCAACRDELAHLSPVPQLLRAAPEVARAGGAEPPPEAGLDHLLRRVRADRAGRRRRGRLLAAAAVVMVLFAFGGGYLVPHRTARPPATTAATPQVDRVARFTTAAGSTTAGVARFTARQWGTMVAVELTDLPPDGPYVLRLLGRNGQTEQAATWGTTPSAAARLTGASSMQLPTVKSAAIEDCHGHVLATADLAS